MGKDITIKYIYKRDYKRHLSIIKGFLSQYNYLAKKHWSVRQRMAEDIWQKSLEILLDSFPEVVDLNYQSSRRALYTIFKKVTKYFVFQDIKTFANPVDYQLRYNEYYRKR